MLDSTASEVGGGQIESRRKEEVSGDSPFTMKHSSETLIIISCSTAVLHILKYQNKYKMKRKETLFVISVPY
jgi:hypothetical protein